MEKKVLLIVNPNSSDGIARNWVFEIIETLSKRYESVTVYLSKCAGDIIRYVSENAKGYDSIVCCGGDGTVHEVLNGIYRCGEKIPLGYIPTGTTNDFAVTHGIPKNIKSAMQIIPSAEAHEYDAGLLDDMAFTYVAAFGAFIDVTYKTPQNSKASFGWMAYIAEGAKRLPDLKPYSLRVETDEKEISGDFILGMVSNTKSVGGMGFLMAGETTEKLSDGVLDVMLISYPDTAAKLQQVIRELTVPSTPQNLVMRFTTEKIKFTFLSDPPEWTADGEFGGKFESVTVKVLPREILLLEEK